MKCEGCLRLLEEYFDGALIESEAQQVSSHLVTCAACAHEFDLLTAEQEIYERYDRELEIPPSLWQAVAARTTEQQQVVDSVTRFSLREWINGWFAAPAFGVSLAGAIVVLLIAAVIGIAYLKSREQQPRHEAIAVVTRTEPDEKQRAGSESSVVSAGALTKISSTTGATGSRDAAGSRATVKGGVKTTPKLDRTWARQSVPSNQDDVLFSEAAYSAAEEQDTLKHLEQAQNLLRSVRNLQVSDDDGEIDVSYEKALSRRLLNENVVLRRDAEMSGKFPVKTLLSSLEPFLIDIANLPDKTSAEDLRVIKERVQKTEIVAALHSY